MDTINHLSKTTVILHWLVALSIIGLIGLGLYMTENEQYDYYHWHKSLGLLLVSIILIRVFWRAKKGWPKHVAEYSNLELFLAKTIHWILLLSTILMPIWGMLYSGGSGHGFGVFSIELFHSNHSPDDPSVVVPLSEFWSNFGQAAHKYNDYIFIGAIILHIVGAFKHHLIDKDSTLLRMLGKKATNTQLRQQISVNPLKFHPLAKIGLF